MLIAINLAEYDTEDVQKYILDLTEHLKILLEFLEGEFSPTSAFSWH
jgi:hypothetical protein